VARRGSALREALTFGGQAPLAVGGLIVAMAVATALPLLFHSLGTVLWLASPRLAGDAVVVEAWRYLTWPFVQPPQELLILTLLFAGVSLLWLGRQLAFAWSEGRFLLRFFVIAFFSGLLSQLAWALLGVPAAYAGMWPMVNALTVTWGLIFPHQRISWFGAVQMSGAGVARLFFVGTPIYALVMGASPSIPFRLLEYLPHHFAIGLAWLLITGGPHRFLYRLTSWWEARRLASARRRFKVIDPGRPPREYLN
jgi:hypothetical protein